MSEQTKAISLFSHGCVLLHRQTPSFSSLIQDDNDDDDNDNDDHDEDHDDNDDQNNEDPGHEYAPSHDNRSLDFCGTFCDAACSAVTGTLFDVVATVSD